MEESLQPYHVPQQSRREKLRFTPSGCAGLLPSLVPSDLLTCANTNNESSNLQIDPTTFQIINSNPFLNFPTQSQSLQAEPLSLSLSSVHNNNSNNIQRFASSTDVVQRSSVGPLRPFMGHASVLKGSRFLKPAQQLLEELCEVGRRGIHAAEASSFPEPPPESLSSDDPPPYGGEGGKKKSGLLNMLDEVYTRYRQFYQHMQAIVTSFEYISGLCNVAPYASLAMKAMSKHFKCLKNVITHQLHFANKAHFHKIDGHRGGGGPHGQIRASHNPEFLGHQLGWRPQRGLPERAVTVLRAWLFEHFLHPYPTDTDKLMLAKQTGLSRSQVANWFINARVRLWKPMVEEIHMLETRQPQKHPHTSDQDQNNSKNKLPSSDKFHQDHVPFNKRPRTYEPSHYAMPVTHGVSLTLGLHQNNAGLAVSEPFPLNETRRFGLAVSGSESQNLHHFVG